MFVKYVKGDDYMTLDNSEHKIGEVVIEGTNPNDTRIIDLIINKKIALRNATVADVEGNSSQYAIKDGFIVKNTACDKFFLEELPVIMERRGYKMSSN